jgi:CheY-like chemotaxis protein
MMVYAERAILVVEDEKDSREFLVQILEFEGFRAVGAANGAEALRYLEQSDPPCLIILDLRMPVMDGAQFRAAMLREARFAAIPVVVVTAFDPPSASGLSPIGILRKPVNIETLIRLVRTHC